MGYLIYYQSNSHLISFKLRELYYSQGVHKNIMCYNELVKKLIF